MKIIELKEILNKYPEEYKVKFYIDEHVYKIEESAISPFNNTLFLFGNKQETKTYTKEQLIEQLKTLIVNVENSDKSDYIV